MDQYNKENQNTETTEFSQSTAESNSSFTEFSQSTAESSSSFTEASQSTTESSQDQNYTSSSQNQTQTNTGNSQGPDQTDYSKRNYYQPQYNYKPDSEEMSVGDWMITLLMRYIPVVNIILLIIWAAGGDSDKPSRKTWAIAQLIWIAIGVGLFILFCMLVGTAAFATLF